MPDDPLDARLVELEALAKAAPDQIDAAQFMAILQDRARKAPEDPGPHKTMGDVLLAVGRGEEARLSYLAALRRDPTYAPAIDGLSELHFLMRGEVDAATLERLPEIRNRALTNPGALTSVQFAALLQERIATAPDDPMAYKMLGDIYRGVELDEQAIAAYGEAVRLDPRSHEAAQLLADTKFRLTGAIDAETTELYRKAYQLDTSDLRVGYMAGIGDWRAGRQAEARKLWAEIEAKTPEGDPRLQMFSALRETFAPDSLAAE